VLHADEALFHTGWFVESLATQVLVIFVIRTRLNPLRSRPHPALLVSSLSVVVVAVLLPFSPIGRALGFVAPPAQFFAIIAALTLIYLLLVETVKRVFFHYAQR
jgi:Mg2+-importing ATPase